MVFAARLAVARGLGSEDLTQRTVRVLTSLGLETDGPLPPAPDILAAFRMDKKFHGGVRFVLLRAVGEPVVVEGVTEEELRAVLHEMGAPT
jgi:3-dehydroquinate synthetase